MSGSFTRRQKLEQKERAILDAAREAFLKHGYDGSRMADIAKRAGVAEGTLYLYFKTKNHLMQGIVSDFWSDLTQKAQSTVAEHEDTFDALTALARFHLDTLIDRFDVVLLTQSERTQSAEPQESRGFMRTYVQAFDTTWRRGVDRDDIAGDTPLWAVRDLFFGALEYSARTLKLHPERARHEASDNLIATIRARFGTTTSSQPNQPDALARLEAAVARLEAINPAS